MRDLVLGLDCSTTAAKAIAWNARGLPVAEGRAPIALSSPHPGWWEQRPDDWWSATATAIRGAIDAGAPAERLAAICCTHQRETFAAVDAAGRAVRDAIVWMDARALSEVGRIEVLFGAGRWHAQTGKPASVTPSLPKILWLLEHEPDVVRHACFVDVHAFVARALTGRFATGAAAADPMGLSDPRSGDWIDLLLSAAGLSRDRFPAIVPTGAVLGAVTAEAAAATGLPAGLPVVAGGGDGQVAALGVGLVAPGRAYLNLGTAVVCGVVVREAAVSRAFRTMAGVVPGTFVLESDLRGGAWTTEWMRTRLLGGDASPADLDAEASVLPAGADGLVAVPYWAGVMNPHWDDAATGIVVGWHGGHGRAHLWRALLEGIALEQRLALDAIDEATGAPVTALVALGGGAASDLWCGIVADATGRRVVRSRTREATCLGAGILAAVAAGLHPDVGTAVRAMTGEEDRSFVPGADAPQYDLLFREVYRDLYPALRETLARLAKLRHGAHQRSST